jgi:hypothetical protein
MVALRKTKEEIMNKARELGVDYEEKYQGCAQCSFGAVVDALRWGGVELIPQDVEEQLLTGLTVLSGGVAMTGDGSCGAVTGGGLAIGLAMGISREMQLKDRSVRRLGYAAVQKGIVDKYYEKYNSILCKDVQRKRFGKAWDLTRPEMSEEYLRTSGLFDINERTPERQVCLTPDCTIALAAMWAVEYILDELEKGNLRGQYKFV